MVRLQMSEKFSSGTKNSKQTNKQWFSICFNNSCEELIESYFFFQVKTAIRWNAVGKMGQSTYELFHCHDIFSIDLSLIQLAIFTIFIFLLR